MPTTKPDPPGSGFVSFAGSCRRPRATGRDRPVRTMFERRFLRAGRGQGMARAERSATIS